MNCGVWRYHPTREVFEVVAHGTTNPWGLDFDDYGEAFITNCVIAHLFRVIPGSHFQRMYGNDFNPHLYDLMTTCADHLHWAGGRWQDSREGNRQHDVPRRRACPRRRHDLPGRQLAREVSQHDVHRATSTATASTTTGSIGIDDGYEIVARHNPDFLLSSDSWFRGLELKYGPDGGVYVTDWSDIGECHENDADNAHRENGRIFKVTYGDVRAGEGGPGAPVRRGAGAAPAPRQRVVRPHGAPAAPGPGRRGQGPGRGASRAARDPRDRSRRAAPAPRHLGAARHRRPGREGPAGAARRPQPAGPRLGRPIAGGRRPAVGRGDRSARGDGGRPARGRPGPSGARWCGSTWPRRCSASPRRVAGRSPRPWPSTTRPASRRITRC